ncbi:MAG: D-2-hydroxyacid dehydrogenase [Clostridiales Family XIII bacterium]|jgi:D-3-phosphoglycerate dehydrogenase|nr:D-2-hydroxyacid dehydrogenase [Clostridiales Family XIII bacterium]
MLRILASDGIDKDAADGLRQNGFEVAEQFYGPEELAEQVKRFDALVVRSKTKVRRPAIDAAASAGRLKLIVRGGVGMDNIDVDYARSKGISVRNTPMASSASVAEMAIGHMFALARHIHEANVTMREGRWEKKSYEGVELAGKTLGLIGFGRIGKEVASKASALGMAVAYTNRSGPKPENAPYRYLPFDELLQASDFISLHMPAADGPVITAESLAKMKDGVFLINTARGGLIPDDVIIEALESGKAAGVALDVFPEEPPSNEAIWKHPKISLTPHLGASTIEAQRRIGEEISEIICAHFAADPVRELKHG